MEPVPPQAGAAPPPADPPKPAEAAPSYVTDDQLQAALTTRFRGFEQKIDKTLTDTLGALVEKLRGELAPVLALAKPEPGDAQGGQPEGGSGPAAPAPSPELRKLQDQITLLTKQADDARSERDTERARGRDSLLRQRVTDALSGVGIEGVRARHAVGLLVDAERRVRWSDAGDQIVFRTDAHDDLELGAGVREWLKTDDAKLYMPPRGAAGSGDRPGGQPPPPRPPSGPLDRTTVAEGLRRALLGQM